MDSLLWQIFENSDSFLYLATWCNSIKIVKKTLLHYYNSLKKITLYACQKVNKRLSIYLLIGAEIQCCDLAGGVVFREGEEEDAERVADAVQDHVAQEARWKLTKHKAEPELGTFGIF